MNCTRSFLHLGQEGATTTRKNNIRRNERNPHAHQKICRELRSSHICSWIMVRDWIVLGWVTRLGTTHDLGSRHRTPRFVSCHKNHRIEKEQHLQQKETKPCSSRNRTPKWKSACSVAAVDGSCLHTNFPRANSVSERDIAIAGRA